MMHKSPQKLSHFGWTDIVCKYGYVHVSGVGGGTGLGDRMPYWLAADDVRDAGGARYPLGQYGLQMSDRADFCF